MYENFKICIRNALLFKGTVVISHKVVNKTIASIAKNIKLKHKSIITYLLLDQFISVLYYPTIIDPSDLKNPFSI